MKISPSSTSASGDQEAARNFRDTLSTATTARNSSSTLSNALLPTPLIVQPPSAANTGRAAETTTTSLADSTTSDQPAVQNSSTRLVRYKTEMCRNFKERGVCIYGDQCQFAHGHREMREVTRNTKYKTKRCMKYWTDGYCVYGPRCNFLHMDNVVHDQTGASELLPESATTITPTKAKKKPLGPVGHWSGGWTSPLLVSPLISTTTSGGNTTTNTAASGGDINVLNKINATPNIWQSFDLTPAVQFNSRYTMDTF